MESVCKTDLEQCFSELGITPKNILRLLVGNATIMAGGKYTVGDVDFAASEFKAMEVSITNLGLKVFIQHDEGANKSIYLYPFADIKYYHIKPNGYMAIAMKA